MFGASAQPGDGMQGIALDLSALAGSIGDAMVRVLVTFRTKIGPKPGSKRVRNWLKSVPVTCEKPCQQAGRLVGSNLVATSSIKWCNVQS